MVNVQIGFGAPLVSTPPEIVEKISNELKICVGQKIYELGCGDARVLCYLAAQNPEATFIGIDKLASAVILAKLKVKRLALKNVQIKWEDLYYADLASADHLFLWIYPHMMNKLLPKLKKELKSGATVLSMDFGFKNLQSNKTIPLEHNKNHYAQKLLVYNF